MPQVSFSSVQLRASLADPDIWARERGGNGLLGSGMPFGRGMPGLVLEGEGTGERRFRAAEGTDGRGEGDCAPALDGCGFASVDKVFGVPSFRASKAALRAWNDVKRLPEAVVTFDLYDYGLVFYDRSKQRQDYIVNF